MRVHLKRMLPGLIFVISLLSIPTRAFETSEMQMFDLVEEVKISFYEFLGVSNDASSTDIRKAYRKLSLTLHPDKNPESKKEFTQLSLIYGILKDEEMRKKYDDILEHGLPDWRQPVYYFRQLRKMSNVELGIVSLIMGICIHYACIWGIAYENRWTKKEQLAQVYKRHKFFGKKREEIDKQIQKDLEENTRIPGLWDILPFAVIRWIKYVVTAVPKFFGEMLSLFREQREQNKKQGENEKLLERQRLLEKKGERPTRTKPQRFSCPGNLSDDSLVDLRSSLIDLDSSSISETKKSTDSDEPENEGREWLEDEVAALVNTINKIVSGTPNRWTKIAKKLGRSEKEVLAKAKQLNELAIQAEKKQESRIQKLAETANAGDNAAFTSAFEVNDENAVCGDEDSTQFYSNKRANRAINLPEPTVHYDASAQLTDEDEEEDEDGFVKLAPADEHQSRKKQRQNKTQDSGKKELASAEAAGWSQAQQKMLEAAMKSISKGTPERWDRIAECVEGKTKEEVITRAKHLVQMCKKSEESLFANL